MNSSNLQVKRLHPDAMLPQRGSAGAAGFDLYCVENHIIHPGAGNYDNSVVIPTGIAIKIPFGFYGRIAPRSGLAVKYSLNVHAGVIDPDYTGEIKVALINHGPRIVEIKKGERIAQLILEWYSRCDAEWTGSFEETHRGSNGFGSTGR